MSEKSKNILLGVLIVGLVSMTVAYAALSTNLAINGTATVAATTWDIHFANVAVDETNGNTNIPSTDYNLGTLTQTNSPTLINGMTATLKKPGDKLVVNFDIVNAGTIDAKNTSFVKHITKDSETASTADTNDVVTYTIDCGTGAKGTNDVLTKSAGDNATSHCKLTVQYDNNAVGGVGQQRSQTAGQDQTVNQDAKTFTFDAAWVYQQN